MAGRFPGPVSRNIHKRSELHRQGVNINAQNGGVNTGFFRFCLHATSLRLLKRKWWLTFLLVNKLIDLRLVRRFDSFKLESHAGPVVTPSHARFGLYVTR